MINLIWAMDENRLIGDKNRLPWHYPTDLKHFNNLTRNKIVLMGHETYLSLKGYYKSKRLPYQKIYVANLNYYQYEDAILVSDAINFLKNNQEELWVIGGKMIYELSLPFADNLYITYILNRHVGNIYLKSFSLNAFTLTEKRVEPGLIFTKYERKR
ncbi:MAG: dihydrofolate reductase [Acholeplasmataceae bacterium]|jgi:dihydrofolate reductase